MNRGRGRGGSRGGSSYSGHTPGSEARRATRPTFSEQTPHYSSGGHRRRTIDSDRPSGQEMKGELLYGDSDEDVSKGEAAAELLYGDSDENVSKGEAAADKKQKDDLFGVDADVDAYGGLPKSVKSPDDAVPDELDKCEDIHLPNLQVLMEKVEALRAGSNTSDLKLTRDQLYSLLPSIREVIDEANSQVIRDRETVRGRYQNNEEFAKAIRTPGQFAYVAISEPHLDPKVPVGDPSRVSTPLGVDSKKIRPVSIIQPMRHTALVVVGASRSGREITDEAAHKNPGLLDEYIRVVNKGTKVNGLNRERHGVIEVENGGFLRPSAVLQGGWLAVVRYEDICGIANGKISEDSAKGLILFLTHGFSRAMRAFGQEYKLYANVTAKIEDDPNAKFTPPRELSFCEQRQEEQMARNQTAQGRAMKSYRMSPNKE